MQTVNPEFIEEIKHTINTSPYPKHMSMRLAAIDFDMAEIVLDTGPQHLQPYGIVHGGVFATLIDTATFWAGFLRIPENAGLINIDLKLNYLKPVTDQKMRAVGMVLRPGKTVSYAEAKVYDETGDLVAHGTSSLMILPGKGLKTKAMKFIE
ncbi:MAG: PaaI family thioesterase [Desulfatibacillum sp.]|nr:PaaI family thioesterase [Desulfatibacillum sp.]